MIIQFTPEAVADLESQMDFYSEKSSAVTARFGSSINEALQLLAEHPWLSPKAKGCVRGYILREFPYIIYYSIENDRELWVLAILHVKRNPDTIDERLG